MDKLPSTRRSTEQRGKGREGGGRKTPGADVGNTEGEKQQAKTIRHNARVPPQGPRNIHIFTPHHSQRIAAGDGAKVKWGATPPPLIPFLSRTRKRTRAIRQQQRKTEKGLGDDPSTHLSSNDVRRSQATKERGIFSFFSAPRPIANKSAGMRSQSQLAHMPLLHHTALSRNRADQLCWVSFRRTAIPRQAAQARPRIALSITASTESTAGACVCVCYAAGARRGELVRMLP